jgi:DNA-binding response OmpR family regulator
MPRAASPGPREKGAKNATYLLVVGDAATLRSEDGAASQLARLGAPVRTSELFASYDAVTEDGATCRAVVIESGDRPDIATLVIRSARKESAIGDAPILVAIPERQVARLDPGAGFDDFIVAPYFAAELYARIRMLEWRRSEFAGEEMIKIGTIVVDVAAHEVRASGRSVPLTSREFSLLAFLIAGRGKVFSRETLLARVWGAGYDGGARTVDIHVRRLRAKLGDALPLETVRGAGYKLRAPSDPPSMLDEDEPFAVTRPLSPPPPARSARAPGIRRAE